ncbi:MAG TPA: MBOAT family O-acyltransferase [Flavisolibacter sp.]|nr:MBOAT family O-acyltransferase [Flavisolibacter sp.]
MLFNSYSFIVFFLILLVLHNKVPLPWKIKKINLLFASYLFYALWNPPFVILLWLSTAVDFFVGKKLYYAEGDRNRKFLLVISLICNLGMLGFFKYGGFLLDNFVALMSVLGIDYQPAKPNIILPVGISFYTFQTLSYTLDMYRRKSEPERSLLDFSLFVTFFPQLVAGPIVRPNQLLPQFKVPHVASSKQFVQGLMLLSLGLFMKVVLADSMLSGTADAVFAAQNALHPLDAWMGVLAFSGQIFFDFAGYSTCAIGIAACLGFSLPDNFLYPYAAVGFSDFWRRWHITLSSWLRDYLYIPLGGNRVKKVRIYWNLMATMLIGGLWHGAAWTFVVWGGLHGLYLCIEKFIHDVRKKHAPLQLETITPAPVVVQGYSFAPAFFKKVASSNFSLALLTFFLVNITWVFFRATDFTTAWRLLSSMFGNVSNGAAILTTVAVIKVAIITIFLVAFHWMMRNTKVMNVAAKMSWWALGIIWAVMLIILLLTQYSSSAFIYFQF